MDVLFRSVPDATIYVAVTVDKMDNASVKTRRKNRWLNCTAATINTTSIQNDVWQLSHVQSSRMINDFTYRTLLNSNALDRHGFSLIAQLHVSIIKT